MGSKYSVEELKDKETFWLMQKRASLAFNEETNQRFADELERRGVTAPPLPEYPIFLQKKSIWKRAAFIVAIILAGIVPKIFMYPIIFGLFVYLYFTLTKAKPYPFSKEQEKARDNGRKDGVNDLMIVAAGGDVKRAEDLLNYGFDVNAITKSGLTALMYAAKNNQKEMCKLLVARGADIKIKSAAGKSAKDFALESGLVIDSLSES